MSHQIMHSWISTRALNFNLKAARQLATEITESGAKLYDLLG
jgi:hypothetical protein